MVRALPGLSAPAGDGPGHRAGDGGGEPGLPVHRRRSDGRGRGLPGDASGEPRAGRGPGPRGSVGDRTVADPARRVPVFRRDHRAQSPDGMGGGGAARRRDAHRLSAGHVRPRRADAADPGTRRDRARGAVARGARLGRGARLPLARTGRLRGAHRVPLRRLRQRPGRPPGARPDRARARRVRGDDGRAVGRRSGAGHGGHRPQRARPTAGGLAAQGVRRGAADHRRHAGRVHPGACARRGDLRRHR